MINNLDSQALKSMKNFLFDCDGVLWKQNNLIPGATKILNLLKENGKRIFLVTNNSTISVENYIKKCDGFGIKVKAEEVVCSSNILANYMKSINFKGKVYIIGEEGIRTELNKVGIENYGVGEENRPFHSINSDPNLLDDAVTGVVIGFDRYFNLTKMAIATAYIVTKKCQFFATNDDVLFPTATYPIPGTGAMVNAVATATKTVPVITGKPHSPMFKILQEKYHLKAEETIMIGDNLDTDIEFGNNNHMSTLLVLSGITNRDDLKNIDKNSLKSPKYITESVADLIDIFKTH